MKTKRFRLLTVFLTAVMLVALSLNVYAAQSNAVTQDGLTAQLFTGKDYYKSGESVNATVRVDNHTGKEVFIWTSINVPEGVTLANENAVHDAVLQDGESWTTPGGTVTAGSSTTGSATATGDNMQAGFWVILTALAVCGVMALFVYGKNKKTWLSMLLCMAMVGGLVVAAVPVQAAGTSGSMEVSRTIQVDGKDAEVSGIVEYIIYDDADEEVEDNAEESTETVSPSEPSEDTSEPGNADEPSDTPDASADADETGYYLVWEDFTNPYPNTWSDNIPSSWDAQVPAGGMQYVSTDGMKIASMVDESEYAEAILQREFNAVSGAVVWEFSLNATGDVTGAVVKMQSGDKTAIAFTMNGTNLMLGETVIAQVPGGADLIGIKVELDTNTDTFEVIVDGQRINTVFNFEEACDSVNRMYLRTTEANVGTLGLSLVRVYTNLYINEKFLVSTSTLPDEWIWNNEGTVKVVKKFGSVSPDIYSLKMTDESETTSTVISTDVTYTDDEAWLEYQFLIPEGSKAELAMVLTTDDGEEFKVGNIYTEKEKYQFGYYNENGEFIALYDDMIDEQWYHVLVKVTREGTLVYLNHKLKAEGISLSFLKFDTLSFETSAKSTGTVYLDDILLKDYVDYPDDYVAEPALPEEDEYIVGMQSCSLWKEGSHFGWDWISDWEERQSLLGFYDEMTPEAADWEIKWMLEHSVDFEMFCWYRPPSGADEPIKQPRNAYALEEAFFNAKYSDMMKFAISWENGSGTPVSGSEDFRENVVTYWIEQYFKDDRYMLVDGKPVVGIYNFADLKTQFGSVAGIKAEIDYLKQACIDAGFEGCIVLLSSGETSSTTLQEYKDAGFDCLYAYNWGPAVEAQKDKMLVQSGAGVIDMMPTICMGRDDAAWERTAGSYLTDGEFRTLAEWVRDDFMPTLDEDSLGKRMVMIGNWNEYGEGHYVMPSNLNGFGYLDTLRAVFGDGDEEHTDVVPTETQRERINRMYIQDRVVPRTYTKETTDEIPTEAKLAWYFETAGDTEGWTVVKQVENLTVANGAISGTSTDGDPGLISADNLNIAVGDVPYIRVRIKVDPVNTAQKLRVYFITTKDTTWNSTKNVKINFYGESNEYVEYLFDTSANTAWKGTIKQIRIDPLEEAGTFSIDSIELLQTPSDSEVVVQFEGEEIFTTRPVYVENDHVMFPAEELADYITTSWSKSLDDESLLLYINEKDYLTINYNTAEATLNGETIEVTSRAMIIDGEHYFPLAVLEAVGYTVTWDKTAGTVNVTANAGTGVTDDVTAKWPTLATDMDVPDLPAGMDVIKAWYFNEDAEGWTNGGTTALTWKDGVLYMYDTSSNDPKAFSTSGLNIDTSTVSNIRIRVRTDIPSGKLKLYFATTDDTTIDNNKVFKAAYADVTPGSDGYYTFDIATNELTTWTGTLDYLRITPASTTGKFYIDSMELLGNEDGSESGGGSGEAGGDVGSGETEDGSGESSGSTEMNVPALPENTQIKLGWYFDEDAEEWTENADTTLVWSDDGTLKVNSTSGTTGIRVRSPENLNIATSDITYVRVRIKAVDATLSATAKFKLYFWLEGDTEELANQAFKPVYSEHTVRSDGYYTFDIACSSTANTYWTGTLSRLAIDPVGDKAATYYIDSVELLESTGNSGTGSDLDESLMSLNYTFTNDVAGSAKGTMTFAFGDQMVAEGTTVQLAWATGNATVGYTVLPDYTAIKTLTATEAVAGYTITKDMIIPETATALAATVTDNGKSFVVGCDIPAAKLLTAEEPGYILALASEFHFGGYGATNGPINQHKKALAHINEYANAMVVSGDITQWFGAYSKAALDTLYDADTTNDNEEAGTSQWEIATNYFKQYTIPIYMLEGNHDTPSGAYPAGTPGVTSQRYKDYLSNWIEYSVTNGFYEDAIERESIIIDEETGAEPATFYDDYINGYHLIFLRVPYEGTYNPPEVELNWLDEKLYEYEESGKPIFIFVHAPYNGTVGHEDDIFTNQFTSEKFGEIIAKHPSVVVVSGHTHYTLDTDIGVSTINGAGVSPSFINDGGIISLRTPGVTDNPTITFTEVKGESQCVYAEIYEDKIITRGYDLIKGKWISQAVQQIDLASACEIAELKLEAVSNADEGTITLTASSATEGLTYQWYVNGTEQTTGASVTVSSALEGYVAVRATDSNGQYRSMSYNMGDMSDSTSPTAGWPTLDADMDVPALPTGTAVAKGWYFTDGTENWTVGTGTTIIEKAGVLYLKNTTQDPVAYSPEGLNIDASTISMIRVRVRTDNPSGKLKVYFTTTTDSTINNDKRYAVEYAENMLGSDGYYTFDITTGSLGTWTGTIDTLRLTPSSQKNSNFYIDSVELLTTTSE